MLYFINDFLVFCELLTKEFAVRRKTETVRSMVPRQLQKHQSIVSTVSTVNS